MTQFLNNSLLEQPSGMNYLGEPRFHRMYFPGEGQISTEMLIDKILMGWELALPS